MTDTTSWANQTGTTDNPDTANESDQTSSTKTTKQTSKTNSASHSGQSNGLAKSKDPNCHKLTLYLPKHLITQFKAAVAAAPDNDASDVIAVFCQAYCQQYLKQLLQQSDQDDESY